MAVPNSCTVLVVGGGPGGSYAASALAREGVDVVLLEAEKFPRYHIGESQLASIRHFLRFIDLESTFDEYGFEKKNGAAFKLNDKREAYTDFIAANGPNGYSWNVIRAESDYLMFKHARKCGAQTIDGVRVNSIEFLPYKIISMRNISLETPGRPVSAQWSRKDGSCGMIRFEYLVDASGRAGLVSTKYLQNRRMNGGLKNIATWSYWKGAARYGVGSERENSPFFEALTDASGWCWAIPLHDGTLSVGTVMRQDMFSKMKRNLGSPSALQLYKDCLKLAPQTEDLLKDAMIITDIKTASDWSYSASAYAGPYFRIVGDAGCFIDPFFSSGVHLALASGLSAAMTIQAARKRDCDELSAANWHSNIVAEGYTRFLLIVLTALQQIWKRTEPILSDFDEDGFDKAFSYFRPIIQGTADAEINNNLTQSEVSKAVDFCLNAFKPLALDPETRQTVLEKAKLAQGGRQEIETLTEDEIGILSTIRARQMLRTEDTMNIENFSKNVFGRLRPNLKQGSLGLVRVSAENGNEAAEVADMFDVISR